MPSICCNSRIKLWRNKKDPQRLNLLQISIAGQKQTFHQKKMIGQKLRKIIKQLFLMFSMLKKKTVYPAYISKHNSYLENQVIF